MKMVMRPRYYCEFCKKASGSPPHMKKHEERCTNNPGRKCGICAMSGLNQKPIADLIAALGAGDAAGMAALRDLAENCPACILATFRQSGFYIERSNSPMGQFDFQAERAEWMAEHNATLAERSYGY